MALAPPTLRGALLLDLLQPLLGALDRLVDHAAVQLDLLLARAATAADTAHLPLQVGPAPHEARGHVLQARQFHLQLALMAARALGEDLQDQQGAVVDRHLQMAFQIALLGRAQGLVEQHFLGTVHLGEHADFVGLAAAHEQRRIGHLALAGQACNGTQAGRAGQQAQLFQLAIEMGKAEIHAHQQHWRWRGPVKRFRTQEKPLPKGEEAPRRCGEASGRSELKRWRRCRQLRPWRSSRRGREQ